MRSRMNASMVHFSQATVQASSSSSRSLRRAGLLLACSAALATILAGCANDSSEFLSFAGGGVETEPSGVHSYEVAFDGLWLSRPGRYVYAFDNLPDFNLHSLIDVQDLDPETRDVIDRAGVKVKMTLKSKRIGDKAERLIVRDGLLEGEWAKTNESWSSTPLEYVGAYFAPVRHEQFTMIIEVSQASAPERDIWAVPKVRGGQPLPQQARVFIPAPANASAQSVSQIAAPVASVNTMAQ